MAGYIYNKTIFLNISKVYQFKDGHSKKSNSKFSAFSSLDKKYRNIVWVTFLKCY